MKPLLPIFLLVFEVGIGQENIDLGEINGENIKTCIDSINGKICYSKNHLEICLTAASLLTGKYTTITLSNDGLNWSAFKYNVDWIHNTIDTVILEPKTTFDTIFSGLKENKIFTLPDQKELTANGSVDDGTDYQLTFKAGDKFRSYEFNNPELYIKYNRDIPAFRNYINIVEILCNGLKSKQ